MSLNLELYRFFKGVLQPASPKIIFSYGSPLPVFEKILTALVSEIGSPALIFN